ncbi:MAG: nucleotidyltransferase, partial [Christensenellaceae bacterium]|nr:nucleotidyltransferase [Christensenellaceae bacterium]
NADDFYGRTAFETVVNYLQNENNPSKHSMVAYKLINTLTENGHVARGVCTVYNSDNLVTITERTHIEMRENGGAFTEDGINFIFLDANTPVSMNLWGFQHSILDAIESNFENFLRENLAKNPLKCEYFLPFVPDLLLKTGKASVKVLHTAEKWYGVTYKDDKPNVMAAIENMKNKGLYPRYLWR